MASSRIGSPTGGSPSFVLPFQNPADGFGKAAFIPPQPTVFLTVA